MNIEMQEAKVSTEENSEKEEPGGSCPELSMEVAKATMVDTTSFSVLDTVSMQLVILK